MNFDQAFDRLMEHEGAYTAGVGDPGMETKYGISRRSYPNEDIKCLTIARAKAIYLRDFWAPARCVDLPDALRFDVFDTAVNSGVRAAIRTLQRAVGTEPDGVLGPKTLAAAQSMPAGQALCRFNGLRLSYLASLPNWPTAGKGWARRIAANLIDSATA